MYQLSMLEAYAAGGMNETAVFELFVRRFPRTRGFLMVAGVAQLAEFLREMCFKSDEIDWLRASGRFSDPFVESLADFQFTGDVDAMPEGTVFFPDEPIIRVTAPLPQAQLVETRLMNLVHFSTVVASKAARMVLAAPGKAMIDFGLRRAHGAEAGLLAARAAYLAGFAGTATMEANRAFGIPIFGTMAHSFIQAHDDEEAAFVHFSRVRPRDLTLLIDTYDTERAAGIVARLAPRLAQDGIAIGAVRLDSGDLGAHARAVRMILDGAGQHQIRILASGGLDETALRQLADAPIDGFGVGTSLTTSSDAPALDCAYKLQEYAGKPRRKRSEGKATWPGRKQVFRHYASDGTITGDVVVLETEVIAGEPLLVPVMRGGKILPGQPDLAHARARAARSLQQLPDALRRLESFVMPVEISTGIRALAEQTGP
jgi:nicotinate phosphoribosyltransferase